MNWGVKILLTLITIVVVTVSVGIYMVSQDTDSLVEDGYYEKGLDYESVIDHQRNVETHNAKPAITVKENYLEFLFKEANNQGEIILNRPSDQHLDKLIPFSTTDSKYTLSLNNIQKGAWEIQISWKHNDIPFYFEKRIYIQ
jgi:hypothetical protein